MIAAGRLLRAGVSALALLALGACADMQMPHMRPLFGEQAKPVDPATQMPALEARIYELICAQRHLIDPNAKDLALDSELVDVARQRSADMAAKNSFADGDERHISATRLMAEDAKFQGLLGENIAAQHYTVARGVDVEGFAQRFVTTWLASPSHKENLSFADYNRTGVGAALSGDTVYVTELFASDLGLGPHQDNAPPSQVTPFPSAKAAKASNTPPAALRGAGQ